MKSDYWWPFKHDASLVYNLNILAMHWLYFNAEHLLTNAIYSNTFISKTYFDKANYY